MKIIAMLSVAAAGATLCGAIHAESLRCNGDLAGTGDSKAAVLYKCGAPYFAESFCKPVAHSDDMDRITVVCVPVDDWAYNPGSGQFITIMRFENGVVSSIRFGPRVQ